MTRKNKAVLLVLIASSVALAAYLLQPHSTVGDWESTKCDVKLSVFKDKTAIYENVLGTVSCEWSAKDEDRIVLKCRVPYSNNDNDEFIRTFKSGSGKAGVLNDTDRDRVLVIVEPAQASCGRIKR